VNDGEPPGNPDSQGSPDSGEVREVQGSGGSGFRRFRVREVQSGLRHSGSRAAGKVKGGGDGW
jgi:hypothetical protein